MNLDILEPEGRAYPELIPEDDRPWFLIRPSGRHRLTYWDRMMARLDRMAARPLAALLVAAGAGFITSGVIEFLRLVN